MYVNVVVIAKGGSKSVIEGESESESESESGMRIMMIMTAEVGLGYLPIYLSRDGKNERGRERRRKSVCPWV